MRVEKKGGSQATAVCPAGNVAPETKFTNRRGWLRSFISSDYIIL